MGCSHSFCVFWNLGLISRWPFLQIISARCRRTAGKSRSLCFFSVTGGLSKLPPTAILLHTLCLSQSQPHVPFSHPLAYSYCKFFRMAYIFLPLYPYLMYKNSKMLANSQMMDMLFFPRSHGAGGLDLCPRSIFFYFFRNGLINPFF